MRTIFSMVSKSMASSLLTRFLLGGAISLIQNKKPRKNQIKLIIAAHLRQSKSFRKNTLATNSKNTDEVDGKAGTGALYVKVSMDGAPYLRKIDLKNYPEYQELSYALEKMFSCFTIGQCGPHGSLDKDLNESKLNDLLHGSEYVLTYEDKDVDWMLVGDVSWEMFTKTCKRMRIMKGSDAIGLVLCMQKLEKIKLNI
ncbi:hypothetical protein UlMin_026811 [Ulmus minor]